MELTENFDWRTRDGRVLSVSDMDTEHLINTIRMLYKDPAVKKAVAAIAMLEELFTRKRTQREDRLHRELMEEIGREESWGND